MSAATHPIAPGFYWAKLLNPTRMPKGESWASDDWETVELFANNGKGDERYGVFVPGISVVQWPKDFEWGTRIPHPSEAETQR